MAVKSKDVKLRMLIEAVDKTGKKLSNIKKEVDALSKASQKAGTDTKKAGDEGAAGLGGLEEKAKKAEEAVKRLGKAASQLASLGTQLTALGAAFTAAAFFPISAAATFERAMARVLAVTSGAAENFEELSEKAAELGRTTKFTAAEAAAGMEFLGMAGFSAGQIIEAIGPSLMLAAAGSIELAQAADIASNVLQAMQLPVAELTHITNVLATTAANANTNIIQLAEALKYTAPAAAAVGLPIEKLSAMIGVLASNGIHATMAGTSLRGMLISLAGPTKLAEDALESLGVTITKQVDGSIDLVKTMEDLGRANMSLGEATAIFRRTSAAAALVISKQVNIVKELTAANEDSAGSALKMAKTMQENLLGATVLLTSALDGLMRALGAPLMKPLAAIVKMATSVISFLAELATRFPKISGFLIGTVGTLGVLLVSLGLLFLALAGLLKISAFLIAVWTKLNVQLVAMGAGAAGTSASVTLLSGAVAMLGTGLKKLYAIMIAHPLILLGAALVGVIAALEAFAESSEKAAKKAKKENQIYSGVISSFDQLTDKYEEAEEGSKKQKIAARELVRYLEEMAEKNEDLAEAALEAASAIDTETGAIEGAGEALDRFMVKAIEAKMDAIAMQAQAVSKQLDEVADPGRWKTFSKYAAAAWKVGFFRPASEILDEVEKKSEETFDTMGVQAEILARRVTAELLALGRLDPSLTLEQYMAVMEKWGIAVGGLTDFFRAEWNRRIELAKNAAAAEVDIVGRETEDIIAELQARYNTESALLKQLAVEREAARKAAEAAPKETMAELTEKQIELTAKQTAGEEKLGKIQRALGDQRVKAATDFRDSQLEALDLQKERQEIDTSEAGVKRLQIEAKLTDDVVKIREDLLETIKGGVREESGLYEWSAQQKEKAEEKSKKAHVKLRTAEFVYEKKIAKQKLALQLRAERDRISLIEEGADKLKARLDLELKTLEKSTSDKLREEKEYQEARKAIIEKYEKEINDLRVENALKVKKTLAEIEADVAKESLEERHARERKEYDEMTAWKMTELNKLTDDTDKLEEAFALRAKGRLDLESAQWAELWDKRLDIAGKALGEIGDMFTDLYELSGKQSKTYFLIAKAAALAEATVRGAQAVVAALGTPPYGLGAIATAALIAAKVGVQIAKITAAEMTAGGPVIGGSGKKDDVHIQAKRGEYMQPVPAVQYYGLNVMEAIKRRLIPKELFDLADLPVLSMRKPRGYFQAGGPVLQGAGAGFSVNVPINITGVSDPERLGRILPGKIEETVIRVMRQEMS